MTHSPAQTYFVFAGIIVFWVVIICGAVIEFLTN